MTLTALMTYTTALNTGNAVLQNQACQTWHAYQCCIVQAEMDLQTHPTNLGFYTQTFSTSTILKTLLKQTENSKPSRYKQIC
jgi:hypothetical protein